MIFLTGKTNLVSATSQAASEEIIWHCKHYTGRGVMKYYESGAALAKDMGVPVERMAAVTEAHYQAALKMEKDPDGGPFPAYPSGKTWDEPSGKTGSGKKFFHNTIPGSAFATEPFYVAIITPIIHYCMFFLFVNDLTLFTSRSCAASYVLQINLERLVPPSTRTCKTNESQNPVINQAWAVWRSPRSPRWWVPVAR